MGQDLCFWLLERCYSYLESENAAAGGAADADRKISFVQVAFSRTFVSATGPVFLRRFMV